MSHPSSGSSGRHALDPPPPAGSSGTVTTVVEATETTDGETKVLKLRRREAKPELRKKVSWTSETIDNEGLGRKKSKCCCIYVKPKKFGESDTESEDDCENCSGHAPQKPSPSGSKDGR